MFASELGTFTSFALPTANVSNASHGEAEPMRFYQISEPINGQRFFATLDEAKAAAREAASQLGQTIEVKRVTCGDDKASILKLANGQEWCLTAETVYNARSSRTSAG